MRLVAIVAGRAAGMFGGDYLREVFGLGGVLLVAAAAEVGDSRQFGDVRGRIFGVLRQRPVAGFAGHVRVLAGGAGFAFVVVAHQAGVLPSIGEGVLADEVERAGAIVAVLPEGLGDNRTANYQEERHGSQQDQSGPHQMSGIAEQTAHRTPPFQGGDGPP